MPRPFHLLRVLYAWAARPFSLAILGSTALIAANAVPLSNGAAAPPPADPSQQMTAYRADRPKSVIDLQPFRTTQTAHLADGRSVTLISLNPNVNSWFILQIGPWDAGTAYHLQNPSPEGQTITLAGGPDPQLALQLGTSATKCAPWANADQELTAARAGGLPFAPICEGHLFLRNPVEGNSSRLEQTASFVRNNVPGGEMIVGLVKNVFFKDAYRIVAPTVPSVSQAADSAAPAGPPPAQSKHYAVHSEIELRLVTHAPGEMALGRWYQLADIPDIYASALQPGVIDPTILNGPGVTRPLDRIESGSMDYFVAFDLSQFQLGYAVGTANPGLGWSPRPPDGVTDPALPGPDGVGNLAPVVPLGMLNPVLAPRVVATFAAGFKRRHGAFKSGPLSRVNHGSHYGFIQQGVILSKLQPGLATLYVLDDGSIHMKTWAATDDAMLPKIRFARQNGVPLLESNPAGGPGIPGALVASGEDGNWSGSANNRLRTLRAGACMIDQDSKKYLVYGFFSTATPSAMARTFEAYGCRYAMLLDMNALEHTYLAIYDRSTGQRQIEHLMPGMAAVDRKDSQGRTLARFVDYPDNRDFFYMVPRTPRK
ncbi:MAG: hypothetical protein GC186_15175 [Rhodobacteraceae bacterium]|nr:hypothetical protein [Paracoccaceae bacterium]